MENTKQTQYHAAAYVRLSKEDLNSVSGLKAESNSISNQKRNGGNQHWEDASAPAERMDHRGRYT